MNMLMMLVMMAKLVMLVKLMMLVMLVMLMMLVMMAKLVMLVKLMMLVNLYWVRKWSRSNGCVGLHPEYDQLRKIIPSLVNFHSVGWLDNTAMKAMDNISLSCRNRAV